MLLFNAGMRAEDVIQVAKATARTRILKGMVTVVVCPMLRGRRETIPNPQIDSRYSATWA